MKSIHKIMKIPGAKCKYSYIIKYATLGWRDGSAVQSAKSSCQGPEFCSLNPSQAACSHLKVQFQGTDDFLWFSCILAMYVSHKCTLMSITTHTKKIKIKYIIIKELTVKASRKYSSNLRHSHEEHSP